MHASENIVTTIIPVFNRGRMLCDAVNSVLAQTYRSIEIIIVDDGSTDNTSDVACDFVQKFPDIVRYIYQKNAGPGTARNNGLAHASGEFIQYLDSDDLISPRKFELQVQALKSQPEAGVAYCVTERKDTVTGEVRIWARTEEYIENIFPDFLMKRGWDTNCPLWRKKTCDTIGPWSNLRCMEDWEHDLRAGILGIKPIHVPVTLVTVRDHGAARASGMNSGYTSALIRSVFQAHRSIWQKMYESKLTEWHYLEKFSRKMFWIARMCGAHNLLSEANEALSITTRMMAGRSMSWDLVLFKVMVNIMGWSLAVKVSESLYSIREHF